ncbi:hypothetical protein [Aquimarina sp. AU119]|uniref:hypothetical protein n=1 Tax=Aquimarina sp. AU119 TaxID=2108528 RepID=UPI000D68982B|nr:hypothetical protein [Aquimarina sp. AU119]
MKINQKGATRIVILTKKYAIKIPNILFWRMFLYGLLGNMQENSFSKMKYKGMCPVLFSFPGGFLNIMPRCRVLSRNEWDYMHVYKQCKRLHKDVNIPVELKYDSFGWLNDNIVAIDYGS